MWHLLERCYAFMRAHAMELFYPIVLAPEMLTLAQRLEVGLPAALQSAGAPPPIVYAVLSCTLAGHAAWAETLRRLFQEVLVTGQALVDIDYAARLRVSPLPPELLPNGTPGAPRGLAEFLSPGRLLLRVCIASVPVTASVLSGTVVGVYRAGLAGALLRFEEPPLGRIEAPPPES